jgi:CubicO group peptidase (beta-lactamase class C family)
MDHVLSRRAFAASVATTIPVIGMLRAGTQSRAARSISAPGDGFLASLPKLLDVTAVPGLGIAVVAGGKVSWQHYHGVTDVSTGRPVSAETLFPAASLGKPVFAYAVLRLVEEGKLDLHRPLKAYVADHAPSDPRGDAVTALHVLSHSSGYRNWRNAIDQPLVPDFEPGARFQYSGEGFYYLQRVVERIAGIGFERFMDERLFKPFGMGSSTYGWRADTEARLVTGHNRGNPSRPASRDFANRLFEYAERQGKPLASLSHDDIVAAMKVIRPSPPLLPNFIIPNAAGSLLTTVADYAGFLNRVLAPTGAPGELAAPTRERMLTAHTRINSVLAWGLGWGLESDEGRDYLWHWGDNGPFKNFVLAHPATRSAIVIFTNGSNGLRVAEAAMAAATGHRHFAFDWL